MAGWRIPSEAVPSLNRYIQSLYDHTLQGINHCHDPDPHSNGLQCTANCSSSYPLQRCGDICGIVVIVVATILKYNRELFCQLTSKSVDLPFLFIKEPTKYSKYLRLTVASWFVNNMVNINNISNVNALSNASDLESDSDSDCDIPRCNIDQSDEEATGEDGKVHKAGGEKDLCNQHICTICNESFTRNNTLNRHISRKHKDKPDLLSSAQKGNSICLECGRKCRKIVDLRKHLAKDHGFFFRQEVLKFSDKKGMLNLISTFFDF